MAHPHRKIDPYNACVCEGYDGGDLHHAAKIKAAVSRLRRV